MRTQDNSINLEKSRVGNPKSHLKTIQFKSTRNKNSLFFNLMFECAKKLKLGILEFLDSKFKRNKRISFNEINTKHTKQIT